MSASNDELHENLAPSAASEEDLFALLATDSTAEVEIPGGKTVTVRGLTRAEHLWLGKGVPEGDASEIERRMLTKALISPALSPAKVAKFHEQAPSNVIAAIVKKIRDLSGFGEGASKSAV